MSVNLVFSNPRSELLFRKHVNEHRYYEVGGYFVVTPEPLTWPTPYTDKTRAFLSRDGHRPAFIEANVVSRNVSDFSQVEYEMEFPLASRIIAQNVARLLGGCIHPYHSHPNLNAEMSDGDVSNATKTGQIELRDTPNLVGPPKDWSAWDFVGRRRKSTCVVTPDPGFGLAPYEVVAEVVDREGQTGVPSVLRGRSDSWLDPDGLQRFAGHQSSVLGRARNEFGRLLWEWQIGPGTFDDLVRRIPDVERDDVCFDVASIYQAWFESDGTAATGRVMADRLGLEQTREVYYLRRRANTLVARAVQTLRRHLSQRSRACWAVRQLAMPDAITDDWKREFVRLWSRLDESGQSLMMHLTDEILRYRNLEE